MNRAVALLLLVGCHDGGELEEGASLGSNLEDTAATSPASGLEVGCEGGALVVLVGQVQPGTVRLVLQSSWGEQEIAELEADTCSRWETARFQCDAGAAVLAELADGSCLQTVDGLQAPAEACPLADPPECP